MLPLFTQVSIHNRWPLVLRKNRYPGSPNMSEVLVKKRVFSVSKGMGWPKKFDLAILKVARFTQIRASICGAAAGGEKSGELLMKIGEVAAQPCKTAARTKPAEQSLLFMMQ